MAENVIFATPHTYNQGFESPKGPPKGLNFRSKVDPKSGVKTEPPQEPPF